MAIILKTTSKKVVASHYFFIIKIFRLSIKQMPNERAVQAPHKTPLRKVDMQKAPLHQAPRLKQSAQNQTQASKETVPKRRQEKSPTILRVCFCCPYFFQHSNQNLPYQI